MMVPSLLIPLLRILTRPLRALPAAAGALIAIGAGGGIGVLVFTLVTWMFLPDQHAWLTLALVFCVAAVTLNSRLGHAASEIVSRATGQEVLTRSESHLLITREREGRRGRSEAP